MVHSPRGDPQWVSGILIGQQRPLSYLVQMPEGQVWKRHVDHIRELGEQRVSSPTPNLTYLEVLRMVLLQIHNPFQFIDRILNLRWTHTQNPTWIFR